MADLLDDGAGASLPSLGLEDSEGNASKIALDDMRAVLLGMREKYFDFDVDGNGEISVDEFRRVRVSLSFFWSVFFFC
jgi:Ca2+-binding EF-hand superfamily protein